MTLAVGHGGCAVALLRLRFGGGGMRLSDYRNGLGEGFAQRTRSSGHLLLPNRPTVHEVPRPATNQQPHVGDFTFNPSRTRILMCPDRRSCT